MKRYNSSSKGLIYYIKNININQRNITLLNKEDIRNLDIISNENNFVNILSSNSISNALSIDSNNLEFNDDNILNQNQNVSDEDDYNEDEKLIENFDNLNLEENNDLKYYIIQNIKDIDLSKINMEIKSQIDEYLTK